MFLYNYHLVSKYLQFNILHVNTELLCPLLFVRILQISTAYYKLSKYFYIIPYAYLH